MLRTYIANSHLRKPILLLRNLKRRLYSTAEMRIYSYSITNSYTPKLEESTIHKNSWKDLQLCEQESSTMTRDEFLAVAKKRLNAGENAYTIVNDKKLIHFGWTVMPVQPQYIPEVGQAVDFPTGSTYAYDFFTHPEYRGRKLYQRSLRYILSKAECQPSVREIFVGVSPDNVASRRAIENVGFCYRYSLFQKWRLNQVRRYSSKQTDCTGAPLGNS